MQDMATVFPVLKSYPLQSCLAIPRSQRWASSLYLSSHPKLPLSKPSLELCWDLAQGTCMVLPFPNLPSASSVVPSLEEVQDAKTLLDGFVCSPLDKNLKCTFIEPVSSYVGRLQRTFVRDTTHYCLVSQTEKDVLSYMRLSYEQMNWQSLLPFSRSACLGNGYVLPKNKDPQNKDRPIIPSTKHPARRLLKIAARGWLFIISSVKVPHFNIVATNKLKPFIKGCNKDKHLEDLALVTFDVKNMFTELEHGDVLNALLWIIEHCPKGSIIVSKNRQGSTHFGHCFDKLVEIRFKLSTLVALARFELSHAFFKIGSELIFRQIKGITMGGFQSPPLAMIVAMAAEYKWLASLGVDSKYLAGARYVDDGLVIFSKNCFSATDIIHRLEHCYPASLELEFTAVGSLSHFLECCIKIEKGQLCLYHFNKNATAVLLEGCQKIRKFIPWQSAHPHGLLKNSIIGLLHRMHANTLDTNLNVLQYGLTSYWQELSSLGYPSTVLKQAVKHFLLHPEIRGNSGWRKLLSG